MLVGDHISQPGSFPPPIPTAGEYAALLAIVFLIGFCSLAFIAYLQARGDYFARHTVKALLSLILTLITLFLYFIVGTSLVFVPNHHLGDIWIRDRRDLTYPINVAIGIAWLVSSYAWFRFIFRWFSQKRQKQ